jgi:hypothetical protein
MKRKLLFPFTLSILVTFVLTSCSTAKAKAGASSPALSSTASSQTKFTNDSNTSSTGLSQLSNKTHLVYSGTLGGQPVLLDLYASSAVLNAAYVKKGGTEETLMTGSLSSNNVVLSTGDKRISINARVSADNALTGDFADNGQSSAIDLTLAHAVQSDSWDQRYPGYNTKAVENFAGSVKSAVAAGDSAALSKLIQFPVNVTMNGGTTAINSASDFIAKYDSIFGGGLKTNLADSYTKYLFNNSKGIVLGDGDKNIWFSGVSNSSNLKVIGINA